MPSLIKVHDSLICASQPNADELIELANNGMQLVINLGLNNSQDALLDEEQIVIDNGMQYFHLPVEFEHPTLQKLGQFSNVLEQHKAKRLFIHCAANKRATVFTALHGQVYWQWNQHQADALIKQVWTPTPVWQQLIDELRRTL